MPASTARRSGLLPALVGAGTGAVMLQRAGIGAFVSPHAPTRSHGSVAMRGFKEDFEAWRGALTPEEKALVKKQAQGEFNKKFRKSDDFKAELPEEKINSFATVLGKFFDSEAEDEIKAMKNPKPDPDGLLFKGSDQKLDFSLRPRIVEVDRDADRRYHFASYKIAEAVAKGEGFPSASPLEELYRFKNDDEASHSYNKQVLEGLKANVKDPSPELKALMDKGVPAMGEPFVMELPVAVVRTLTAYSIDFHKAIDEKFKDDEAGKQKFLDEVYPKVHQDIVDKIFNDWIEARDGIEKDVEAMKSYFASHKEMPGKTKADVLQEIWAELPKYSDKPVPPLDEEVLAELAKEPANIEGEKNPWGYASKLWKSEAIDAFGMKYLLGIFENQEDAQKAFAKWNAEYEKARADSVEELAQWSKTEQAKLDADTDNQEAIKAIFETAKSM